MYEARRPPDDKDAASCMHACMTYMCIVCACIYAIHTYYVSYVHLWRMSKRSDASIMYRYQADILICARAPRTGKGVLLTGGRPHAIEQKRKVPYPASNHVSHAVLYPPAGREKAVAVWPPPLI